MRAVDPVVVRRSENGDTKKNRTGPSYNRGVAHTQKKNRNCDNDVFVRPTSCNNGLQNQCEHEQSAGLATGDDGPDQYQDNQDCQDYHDDRDDLYHHEDSSAEEGSFAFTSALTNRPSPEVVSEKKTRLIDSEGKVRKTRLIGDKVGSRLMDEKKTRLVVGENGGKTRLVGDKVGSRLRGDPEVVAEKKTRLMGDTLRIYLNDDPQVVARYEKE